MSLPYFSYLTSRSRNEKTSGSQLLIRRPRNRDAARVHLGEQAQVCESGQRILEIGGLEQLQLHAVARAFPVCHERVKCQLTAVHDHGVGLVRSLGARASGE